MQRIVKVVGWMCTHIYNFFAGFIVAFVGYFSEIEGMVYVVVGAIALDLVTGIWASYKQGKSIRSRKLWRTVEKMTFCLLLIHLTYSASTEIGYFDLHKPIAWGIVGFELWSMLENITKVKSGGIFTFLKGIMEVSVEKKTGVKLKSDE